METKRVIAYLIGFVIGGFIGILAFTWWYDARQDERLADDRCWVAGGVYRDGACEMPKVKYPEAVVCAAMNGNLLVEGDRKRCLSTITGQEMTMPDLTDKEIQYRKNGSVVLKSK